MAAKKRKKAKKKRSKKTTKAVTKKSKVVAQGEMCMPGLNNSDWVHTLLAALIIVFAFVNATWATGVVVVSAALIFISGVMTYCRK